MTWPDHVQQHFYTLHAMPHWCTLPPHHILDSQVRQVILRHFSNFSELMPLVRRAILVLGVILLEYNVSSSKEQPYRLPRTHNSLSADPVFSKSLNGHPPQLLNFSEIGIDNPSPPSIATPRRASSINWPLYVDHLHPTPYTKSLHSYFSWRPGNLQVCTRTRHRPRRQLKDIDVHFPYHLEAKSPTYRRITAQNILIPLPTTETPYGLSNPSSCCYIPGLVLINEDISPWPFDPNPKLEVGSVPWNRAAMARDASGSHCHGKHLVHVFIDLTSNNQPL